MAEESSSSRAPIAIPTYALGDEGKPNHFVASTSREDAAVDAKDLAIGDAAFIKRSDLKWTYAIVTERMENDGSTILRFEVDKDKNRKSFPEAQWGKYIRVIKIDDAELAKLKEEEDAAKKVEEEEEEMAAEPAADVVADAADEKSAAEVSTGSAKSGKSKSSWFGGLFGSPKKAEKTEEETKIVESVPEELAEDVKSESAAPTPPAVEESESVETPIFAFKEEATAESESTMTPIAEEDTKENSDPDTIKITQPPSFLPSSKGVDEAKMAKESKLSALRSPLNLKPTRSLKKMFKKEGSPNPEERKTVTISSPKSTVAALGNLAGIKSPKESDKKEWFDPEACEVDYDKNPTDLFQALEARQFGYADEMYNQIDRQFTRECKTWVVARGQKKKDSAQLRFRALPLHAALVFGAPDDMIKKILNAYPAATRGRDVKGRLPIHLAMEHNASEDVVSCILEAFPKGFFAKDKKDMLPLDYVTENMKRAPMKKYLPLLTAAKVEEERAKWELELQEALAAQKVALKTDPEYMEDVIATITDDVENTYAGKMELVENNYQKEIQLLKKKHDSETQALLEGFEVKLNFERKLQKLKGTKA